MTNNVGKVLKSTKSYKLWGFSNFQLAIWGQPLILAIWSGPHSCSILWIFQRYLGIFEISKFSAIFGARKVKMVNFAISASFCNLIGLKMAQNLKILEIRNKHLKNPKNATTLQIWGPETDLGPKIRNREISSIENLKILKIYFGDISPEEQAFFNSVKSA